MAALFPYAIPYGGLLGMTEDRLIEVLILVLAILLTLTMLVGLLVLLMAWIQPRPPWRPRRGIDIIDPTPPKGSGWIPELDDPNGEVWTPVRGPIFKDRRGPGITRDG